MTFPSCGLCFPSRATGLRLHGRGLSKPERPLCTATPLVLWAVLPPGRAPPRHRVQDSCRAPGGLRGLRSFRETRRLRGPAAVGKGTQLMGCLNVPKSHLPIELLTTDPNSGAGSWGRWAGQWWRCRALRRGLCSVPTQGHSARSWEARGGARVPPPGHPHLVQTLLRQTRRRLHYDQCLPWVPGEGSEAKPWVAAPGSRGTTSTPKIWVLRESGEGRGRKS